MDWIERAFGWAPDGGDGTLELLIFSLVAMAIAGVAIYLRGRSRIVR